MKRLIDLVGPAHARMILYTARRIDAAEAERIGLINKMVADEELNDEVLDIARTIADNAPLSVAASKLTINEMLKDESQRDMAAIAADGGDLLQQRGLQGGAHGVHGEAGAEVGGEVT